MVIQQYSRLYSSILSVIQRRPNTNISQIITNNRNGRSIAKFILLDHSYPETQMTKKKEPNFLINIDLKTQ